MTAPMIETAGKAFRTPFGGVLELRPEGGDPVFVDGRANPPAVAATLPAGAKGADCIWRCPADIMRRALTSNRAVENAVINGRLAIAGDMSVMARLDLAGG